MRGRNDTTATISAAATAIAAAENRESQISSVQKKRWGNCWSIVSCFGSRNQSTKIGHASEPNSSRTEAPMIENRSQRSFFTAPPSSPVSFHQSEPSSAVQSPGGFLSFTSTPAAMFSPSNPANMFAIGPYASETQLVSPPVFSTYTTEPSTAPFTPPSESVHLTTPSSPEVPFARLLGSNSQSGEASWKFSSYQYEFQSYQLYPGSPMGQLISSRSDTSSPFSKGESASGGLYSELSSQGWDSRQRSHIMTPNVMGPMPSDNLKLNHPNSNVSPFVDFPNGERNNEQQLNLSSHTTSEKAIKRVEKQRPADMASDRERRGDDMANGHQKHKSSLGFDDEFIFIGKENGPIKNWALFMQSSVG